MADASNFFRSHVGVWCQFMELGGLGVVVSDEFEFAPDGRCVWRCIRDTGRDAVLVCREGTWTLKKDVISMAIDSSTEAGVMPERRADFKIVDREGRLGLTCTRMDDDVAKKGFCSYFLKPSESGVAARSLAAAKQKAMASKRLPAPFDVLERLLAPEIPAAVQGLNVSKPMFCLRLYYDDTHASRKRYGLRVRVLTEPIRDRLRKKRPTPENLAEDLWCPQSGVANGTPSKSSGLYEIELRGNKDLAKYMTEIYDRLCESEGENMPLLRELARRVCKRLNVVNWEGYAPVTDDFVAFPADGSGHFGDEYEDDLEAAVSASRRKLLMKRGFLG